MSKVSFPASLAVTFVGLFLAVPGGSSALSPPETGSGIIFSNGGRIVSMNADGTGRTYLTRGGRRATWPNTLGQDGDSSPRLSPDGARMVFVRSTGLRRPFSKSRLMLSAADGSGAKVILAGRSTLANNLSPRWAPEGGRLIVVRERWKGGKPVSSVVSIKPNGSGMKTLFTYPARAEKPPYNTRIELRDAQMSPDGGKLLVDVNNAYMDNDSRLEVVDLSSGIRRSLGKQTYSGSWSPDGSSVIFVSSRGSKDQYCEEFFDGCFGSGDIFTVGADGSARNRLTRTSANEDSPSWSADGNRILFTSNAATPSALAATEVYSMVADGTCSVALTNGAPGSFSPVWSGSHMGPGPSCDQPPPPLLTEVEPPVTALFQPVYWPGENVDGQLLTSADLSFGEVLLYEDCDLAGPLPCGAPTMIFSFPTCYWAGLLPLIFGEANDRLGSGPRGATIIRTRNVDGFDGISMLAGKSMSWVLSQGDTGRETHLKMVESMRLLGETGTQEGDLPAPMIPVRDLRNLKKVERAVKRTGSKRRAAKLLGKTYQDIDRTMRFGRRIHAIGPVKSFNCPAHFFSDSDSVSDSSRSKLRSTFRE